MAGPAIKITHNLGELKTFLNRIGSEALRKAVRRSIERTATGVETQITKTIRDYKLVNGRLLKADQIKTSFLKTTMRTAGRAPGEMYAEIGISGKHPYLRNFFARKVIVGRTKRRGLPIYGARVRVMGVDRIVYGGFIPKKEFSVMARRDMRDPRSVVHRLYGPSFATMLVKMKLISPLEEYARARYAKEFEQNFRYFLRQLSRR